MDQRFDNQVEEKDTVESVGRRSSGQEQDNNIAESLGIKEQNELYYEREVIKYISENINFNKKHAFFFSVFGISIYILYSIDFFTFSSSSKNVWYIYFIVAMLSSIVYGCSIKIYKKILNFKIKRIHDKIKKVQTRIYQDRFDKDFFTQMIKINLRYMEMYYEQTKKQANKSFGVALIVSVISFIVILCGIILMYNGNTISGYVSIASGVLSEIISLVFFKFFNTTILKMGEYHEKLVMSQNISLALKLSDELEDGKDETKAKLAELMLNKIF